MKNRLQALILGGVLLAGASVPAMARDNVSFSMSFGAPAYSYYAPPPPVYYAPPAVYYRPAPAPVYYGPPAVGFTVHSGHGWRHHGHGHHHRHHRHR